LAKLKKYHKNGPPRLQHFARSMFVFVPVYLKILLAVFAQKSFYIFMVFIKNLSLSPIWLILTCKLQLHCPGLRRVAGMSLDYQVSKLHALVEYLFLFPLVKN